MLHFHSSSKNAKFKRNHRKGENSLQLIHHSEANQDEKSRNHNGFHNQRIHFSDWQCITKRPLKIGFCPSGRPWRKEKRECFAPLNFKRKDQQYLLTSYASRLWESHQMFKSLCKLLFRTCLKTPKRSLHEENSGKSILAILIGFTKMYPNLRKLSFS